MMCGRTTLCSLLHHGGRLLCVAAVLTLLVCGGCDDAATTSDGEQHESVSRSTSHGPVQAVVRADRGQAYIAEAITYSVEVVVPEGATAELEDTAETLGVFEVVSRTTATVRPVDGGVRYGWTFVLAAYETGEHEIPPLTVSWRESVPVAADTQPAADEQDDMTHTFRTPVVPVSIISALSAEDTPETYRDIRGPVDVPHPWQWQQYVWALVLAGVVVGVVMLMYTLVRRRREYARLVQVLPHEWALRELRRLEGQEYIERGMADEFYYELSYIVRGYIERRFGLHAGHQTTEEFLVDLGRSNTFAQSHRALLRDFLTAADLVKFARVEPSTDDVAAALSAARRFINQTTGTQPTVDEMQDGTAGSAAGDENMHTADEDGEGRP